MKHIATYRWTILISSAILTVLAILGTLFIKINADVESYLPDDIASKVHTDSIEKIFGKDEPLLLVYSSPDILEAECIRQLWQVDSTMADLPFVNQIHSLFTVKEVSSAEDRMIVAPLIADPYVHPASSADLRERIRNNRQVYRHLVSGDFSTTFILLNIDHAFTDREVMKTVQEVISDHPGKGRFEVYGALFMRDEASHKIVRDFILLLPVGLVLMILFLYASFRQKRAVLLPLSVVVISILVCFGTMSLLHWPLSIIGILVPVMMIAIANDYGIHFITKYQELSVTEKDRTEEQIVLEVTRYLKKPVLISGITTIIGVLGMILHIVIPARQIGVISGIGIGVALLLSLSLIPATLILIRRKSNGNGFFSKKNFLSRLLERLSTSVVKSPKSVVWAFGIFLLLSLSGLFRFEVASNFDGILHENHSYSKALHLADTKLGGTKNIRVLFQGDCLDPEFLGRLDRYESEMESWPMTGSVSSLSTLLREMTRGMNDPGDPDYDAIPKNRNAVAQYIELYSMSGDPEDLEDFVDFDFQHALMEVQCKATKEYPIKETRTRLLSLLEDDPAFSFLGGYCLIEDQMNALIAKGQLYSLLFAWIVISLILAALFRSPAAGLIGGLPLLFAVLATMGIMGWTGIPLNIVTALLSSISIGLGVDYTIHLFWRIKKEIGQGSDFPEAIQTSIRTSGYGITINALSVSLGFSLLLLSSFGLIQSVSLLIMFSIAFCLLCSMCLIPVLCLLLKPKFLTK